MTTRQKSGRFSPEILDQQPPADVEAEKRYVGAVLLNRDVLEEHPVNPEDFHVGGLGRLCEAMANYPLDGPITEKALLAWIPREILEAIGGKPTLAEFVDSTGHVGHAGLSAQRIRTAAAKRRIITRLLSGVQHCYNGQDDVGALIGEITTSLESIGDGQQEERFKLVDCATLANGRYDTRFLVDGLLVADQPTILAGAQKTLKTLLAIDIAVSVATGSACLGMFKVPTCGSVVYMTGEGGLGLSQDYAGRIARSKGFELADVPNLLFCDRLPQLALASDLQHLRRILRARRPALLVLDCAYLCMPGSDAGNQMKQGEILTGLNRTSMDCDVTPLLLHHTKRSVANPYAPAELEDISWSGFSEFASGWLLLSRRERYNAEYPGDHRLWLTVGARVGLSSLWAIDVEEGRRTDSGGRRWLASVGRPSDARVDADNQREAQREGRRAETLERHRERLLRAMAKRPNGETASVLRDLVLCQSCFEEHVVQASSL